MDAAVIRHFDRDILAFPEESYSLRKFKAWAMQVKDLEHAYAHVTTWGTAIDVGGYVGLFTLALSDVFDTVLVFEPIPENVECLKKNINGTPGISVFTTAIGNGSGVVKLKRSEAFYGKEDSAGEPYITSSIDSYAPTDVGLIKMDIEGMEMQALEGAEQTIRDQHPVIFIEHKFAKRKLAEKLGHFGYTKAWGNERDSVWAWRT